jgi:8-oxo-dGTP diphosphatase
MRYQPIVGTLAYVWDRSTDAVLMVHRNARPDDEQLGKWNGLGGKLDAHEDVVAGIVRELREEATIEATSLHLRGTVNWPGFGPNGEDWLGFVFVVDGWDGAPPPTNDEGTLAWIARTDLLAGAIPIWEGDAHFLPLVFDDDPRAFHGVMPYSAGRPIGWSFTRLG